MQHNNSYVLQDLPKIYIISDTIFLSKFFLQYKYFYPYEIKMLLPIECSNDFYHFIGSKQTNECFEDANDLLTYLRDDLSA